MQPVDTTIFITGATSGFGEACARMAAREGAKIVICGRRRDRLDKLKKELGANTHALALDVQSRKAVTEAVAGLPAEFAAIDALVNNAGLALGLASMEGQTPEDIEQMVDTNIKGLIYTTQAVLPGMIARGRGHIVNIGSVAGSYPYPGGNVYGATKAFVNQLSLNLRADLLDKNIRVTNIEPGLAETEFSLTRFHGDKAKADAVYKGTQPLTAGDVAETVWWALSRPAHVNINRIELMPTCQAFGPFAVKRA